jgi:hypothetical protein
MRVKIMAALLAAGVAGVQQRGKAGPGDKTMLDALLPALAAIASGGDLDAAAAAGIAVVRTYGMSETAGGCVYDGVPLDGVLNEALQDYHPAPSSGSRDPVYSDGEAAAHVGEVATVVGIVFSVRRSKSGNTFLNFGANYPNQTFSGVILGPQEPALRDLDSLTGRRVGVHGLIRLYRGQAEIQIERAEQIGPIPSSPGDR